MSKPAPSAPAAALPIARVLLRMLIVLNWVAGLGLLGLLFVLITRERWILAAFHVAPSADSGRFLTGLRLIAGLGLAGIPLNFVVLKRLFAIVETVRDGDPFVPANAVRLQAIAWTLLAMQLLSLTVGAIANGISTRAHPLHVSAGFSISGWLVVLMTFLLARVFAEGTVMREDLQGTV